MSGTIISGGVHSTVNIDFSPYDGQLSITTTGIVSVASGKAIIGSSGTIQNDGVVIASSSLGDGISLHSGGTVDNTGSIYGGSTGIYIYTATSPVSIDNAGTISGGRWGINMAQGDVLNHAGAEIYGKQNAGVYFYAVATLINDGTVSGGSSADGVLLSQGGLSSMTG